MSRIQSVSNSVGVTDRSSLLEVKVVVVVLGVVRNVVVVWVLEVRMCHSVVGINIHCVHDLYCFSNLTCRSITTKQSLGYHAIIYMLVGKYLFHMF